MPTAEENEDERTSRFLIEVARSTTQDLYELLNITTVDTATLSEKDLNRAWRAAALQWHPDKNRGNEKAASDRLDEIRKAYDVLLDPGARRAYEDKRRAKREKVEREQAFDVKRRRMKEDLERREGAAFSPAASSKRKFNGVETEDERRERELKRIAAEGARRRAEKMEALRRAAEEEVREKQEVLDGGAVAGRGQGDGTSYSHTADTSADAPTNIIPEVDRTIKVRWPRDHPSATNLSKDRLATLFSTFGAVESALLLRDKKTRPSLGGAALDPSTNIPDKRQKKQLMATGAVVFASVAGAQAAVLAHSSSTMAPPVFAGFSVEREEWSAIDSVEWASGRPPASLSSTNNTATPTATPKRAFKMTTATGQTTPGTPGLFESTMMRLKEAEKRRLEALKRKEEEGEAEGD